MVVVTINGAEVLRLTVVGIRGVGQVKLGFQAPPDVKIYREELLKNGKAAP